MQNCQQEQACLSSSSTLQAAVVSSYLKPACVGPVVPISSVPPRRRLRQTLLFSTGDRLIALLPATADSSNV
eukprot:9107-Heterococcus_DN1.PRE.3